MLWLLTMMAQVFAKGYRADILRRLLCFALFWHTLLITVVAFFVSQTSLVGQPSIPIALLVLAIAQMGVHLVFFLHITTGPESLNNVLALAFGLLIVFLLLVGSLWIMTNLNHNMVPMEQLIQMQR